MASGFLVRRPMDEVVIHADDVRLPSETFAKLAKILDVASPVSDGGTAAAYLYCFSALDVGANESNSISIEISKAHRGRNPPGTKLVDITLDQEWFPLKARRSASKRNMAATERIMKTLRLLEEADLSVKPHCHVDFYFEENPDAPNIPNIGFPLPFPTPFPNLSQSDTPTISGIRLTGAEANKALLFDRLPNGTLHIGIQFELETKFSPSVIRETAEKAESLLKRTTAL